MAKSNIRNTCFCILVTCACLCLVGSEKTLPNCPDDEINHGDSKLAFTRTPISIHYACDAGFAELYCCITGYTQITWFRREAGSLDWRQIVETSRQYFADANRTLILERATAPADETRFRCLATNAIGEEIDQEITLELLDCHSWNHRPLARLPLNHTAYRMPGTAFATTCEGFFGPDYETRVYPSILLWKKEIWQPGEGLEVHDSWIAGQTPQGDGHVTVTLVKYNQYMESHLRIDSVTEADYANYTCFMKNAFGRDVRMVELKKGARLMTSYEDVGAH